MTMCQLEAETGGTHTKTSNGGANILPFILVINLCL